MVSTLVCLSLADCNACRHLAVALGMRGESCAALLSTLSWHADPAIHSSSTLDRETTST